ncbi:MAG: cohesin domain-containing protein [Candidatus Methanoperedens sp.]|nr:cohesin domain-containing protein [Candidatus Methanoperedens sp.]
MTTQQLRCRLRGYKTVSQGQMFNLSISIDPSGNAIAGAQLNIAFNQSILNVNSITEGDLFRQNGASTFFNNGTINNSLGTIVNISEAVLGHSNVSTPGTFIIINATAIGSSGASGINLSNVKISDPGGVAIPLNLTNGVVSITVYPRYDVNEDGIVNIEDLTIIEQHFNEIVVAPYPRYDVNMDGVVDIADLTIAAQHFGEKT